jgi:hypothetical protein
MLSGLLFQAGTVERAALIQRGLMGEAGLGRISFTEEHLDAHHRALVLVRRI